MTFCDIARFRARKRVIQGEDGSKETIVKDSRLTKPVLRHQRDLPRGELSVVRTMFYVRKGL